MEKISAKDSKMILGKIRDTLRLMENDEEFKWRDYNEVSCMIVAMDKLISAVQNEVSCRLNLNMWWCCQNFLWDLIDHFDYTYNHANYDDNNEDVLVFKKTS